MSTTCLSPRQVAEKYQQKREQTYRRQPTDGNAVSVIKWLFGRRMWHRLTEKYVLHWLTRRRLIDRQMDQAEAKAAYNQAVEQFWLNWTGVLLLAYLAAFGAAYFGPQCTAQPCTGLLRAILLGALALLCSFRIVEILTVSFRLHVLEDYWTDMPPHAIVLTFVAYFQVMLCFASLFLAEGFFFNDAFNSGQPIWSGPLNAAYFSTVTIATIGYGDFAPAHWLGKLLVMLEVFVGLVLIVVAFQRVIAGVRYAPPKVEDQPGKATTTDVPE